MVRTALSIIALLCLSVPTTAQTADSTLIATIVSGVPTFNHSPADITCAMATMFPGAAITRVWVAPFGPDWLLLGEGMREREGSCLTIGITLTQHANLLYATSISRWDQCVGIDCAGCGIKRDALDRPYCECFRQLPGTPKCNHSTGAKPNAFINALESCES